MDPDTHAKMDKMVQHHHHVVLQHISKHPGTSMECITSSCKFCDISFCSMGVEKFMWQRMATHTGIGLEHLLRYERETDEFLDHTVKGDESWCLHYDTEIKCMSLQWKYSSFPWPKKSHAITSAGNVMLTLYFDCCGPLLIDWLPQGTTINADHYGETMEHLRRAIKVMRPGKLSCDIIGDTIQSHRSRSFLFNSIRFSYQQESETQIYIT